MQWAMKTYHHAETYFNVSIYIFIIYGLNTEVRRMSLLEFNTECQKDQSHVQFFRNKFFQVASINVYDYLR